MGRLIEAVQSKDLGIIFKALSEKYTNGQQGGEEQAQPNSPLLYKGPEMGNASEIVNTASLGVSGGQLSTGTVFERLARDFPPEKKSLPVKLNKYW